MADFAPTYMDVYDQDQSEVIVLVALSPLATALTVTVTEAV